MTSKFMSALAVALLAAVANGMFVYGQRRSEIAGNPFVFMLLALVVCTALYATAVSLSPKAQIVGYISRNYRWVLLSGCGLFLTFIGFYLLFTRHGATYYTLYSVLAVLTTSIIVGIVMLREHFNTYHLLAIVTALATVAFFALGQSKRPSV